MLGRVPNWELSGVDVKLSLSSHKRIALATAALEVLPHALMLVDSSVSMCVL